MKPIIFALSAVLSTSVAQASVFSISGAMDPLQAGTNGGFGAFDSGVAGAGNGSGTIAGTFDDATKIFNYSFTWQDLSAAASNVHFHLGAPGVSGGVQIAVPAPWTSPYSNTITLDQAGDDTKIANMMAGNWYVNVHTTNFGGGEIRGQVAVAPVPEPSSSVFLLGGIAALLLRRRRA